MRRHKKLYPDASDDQHAAAPGKVVLGLRTQRYCETYATEAEWLWEELVAFRRSVGGDAFFQVSNSHGHGGGDLFCVQYTLEGVPMCKEGWHQLAGWSMKGKKRKQIPRRALDFEARIKKGEQELMRKGPKLNSAPAGNRTDLCRLWVFRYFEQMCDTTPALEGAIHSGRMHYPKGRPGFEWMQYCDDLAEGDRLVRSGFNLCWKRQLEEGWVDPKDGSHYDLVARTVRARGFQKCSTCEDLDEELRVAKRQGKSIDVRNAIRKRKSQHLERVRACRKEYAQHKYVSMCNAGTASSAMDAAAQAGHRLPITASDHKKLKGMKKLQMKITGVLVHGGDTRGYYAIVTPPWLKTGANMTCTIVMALVAWGVLKGKKRWLLQVDGASDNIAYTVMYFAAWLLLMSQEGRFGDLLVLESIVLSRLPVGHTHIDIDQIFSVLARHLWGHSKQGLRALDIHTPDAFTDAIKAAHKNLKKCYSLESCINFDDFLSQVKHGGTDTGIQDWRVFEFRRDDARPGKVFLRTKRAMDSPEWVEWRKGTRTESQFWPNASGADMPGPQQPAAAALKEWAKRTKVLHDLDWFMHQQTCVTVADEVKSNLQAYIDGIPSAVGDVRSSLPWPVVVSPAVVLPAAPPVEAPAPAPALAQGPPAAQPLMPPRAGGLTAAERNEVRAVANANREFQNLKSFRKNDLLVVFIAGHLELGQAAQAVDDLETCASFKMQYWVDETVMKGKTAHDQRKLAEAPPDFRLKFQKFPRKWVVELAPSTRRRSRSTADDTDESVDGDVDELPSPSVLRKTRVAQLREMCSTRALSDQGAKAVLIQRLLDMQAAADVTVFWAGAKDALLRQDGGILVAIKRHLSMIETFPLQYSGTEWEPKVAAHEGGDADDG